MSTIIIYYIEFQNTKLNKKSKLFLSNWYKIALKIELFIDKQRLKWHNKKYIKENKKNECL